MPLRYRIASIRLDDAAVGGQQTLPRALAYILVPARAVFVASRASGGVRNVRSASSRRLLEGLFPEARRSIAASVVWVDPGPAASRLASAAGISAVTCRNPRTAHGSAVAAGLGVERLPRFSTAPRRCQCTRFRRGKTTVVNHNRDVNELSEVLSTVQERQTPLYGRDLARMLLFEPVHQQRQRLALDLQWQREEIDLDLASALR